MQGIDPDLRALQEVRDQVAAAARAAEQLAHWTQAQVDALCAAMARAGAAAAHELARAAVEETGIGRVHYKILKNLLGSEGTWESIQHEKTVGIIARDERRGVVDIATPVGVIACIVPTTNPTSTALNNALIAVKGRNAVVISPHPRARRCIGEAVLVYRRAIERAGGPPDLVCALGNPTLESTGALMKHRDVAMILATGGSGLVQAAYSSGKPAYGVGPGNVPCYIDRSADVAAAARWIVASQSFDNGTLCCSEQGLVLDKPIAKELLAQMQKRGAHLCDEQQTAKLARLCNVRGHMNPDVVGLDPWKVAELAGFQVPRSTSVLLAHQAGVGKEHALSIEILCPLLSVHLVDGWQEGCAVSHEMLHFGGLGHTLGVWARDEKVLDAWFLEKPASRIVVNGPTSEGAVGFSTQLAPALSLGCGPLAGNITSDNISARHLVSVKRAAFPRRDWEDVYRKAHARASSASNDPAPRGSGLPGDPALGGSAELARPLPAPAPRPTSPEPARSESFASSAASHAASNAPRAAAPAPAPVPGSAATRWPAPSFTAGALQGLQTVAPRTSAPRAHAPVAHQHQHSHAAPAPGSSPTFGTSTRSLALRPDEIAGIMAHAGAGCPLGPCQGCPHHQPATGACTA